MIDCCILFLYHKNDEVTSRHLQLIKKHNPDVPVIPLSDEVNGRWEMKNPWRNIDAEVYNWYEGRRTIRADRYIVFEWDCLW